MIPHLLNAGWVFVFSALVISNPVTVKQEEAEPSKAGSAGASPEALYSMSRHFE